MTDDGPWTMAKEPAPLRRAGGLVTLVEGSSFSLSGPTGDICPGGPEGVFVLDARVVSRWELRVDGVAVQPLSVSTTEPFAATFVGQVGAGPATPADSLVVVRRRWVGGGVREDVELRNFGRVDRVADVALLFAGDFADVFDVKAGRVAVDLAGVPAADGVGAAAQRHGVRRAVAVLQRAGQPADRADAAGHRWRAVIPAGGVWQVCLEVGVSVAGTPLALSYRCGQPPAESRPSRRLDDWRRHAPQLPQADPRLVRAVAQAVTDLGSLVIDDPVRPGAGVIAAGAPWFMALFGRDSLLAAYMSLVVDPSLAVGVVQTLARLQGSVVNLHTEEQPGRILHEVRFTSSPAADFDDGYVYYGTADATPLFVLLVGELSRWGVPRAVVDPLLPHVDRALAWIEHYGDRDGDGYVEYERLSPGGLANQGWKDSWDGINAADGTLPAGPIALAEVQGYVYAAYLARADLARERGDTATQERSLARAAQLRVQFDRDFWLPARGWYAVALDGAKQPVDALTSNVGHCLWTGIVPVERAAAVARLLMSDELRSGWGLRTLARSMARYDPMSYHNGSVWPHDTAIAVAGLARYGFAEAAVRLTGDLLDAATETGNRLPELFAGLDRTDVATPVAYPTSCSPQAWSSAAPLLLLRALLHLEPQLDQGCVGLGPAGAAGGDARGGAAGAGGDGSGVDGADPSGPVALGPVALGPVALGPVTVSLAGSRVTVAPDGRGGTLVTGLPVGLTVRTPARR